MYGLLLVLVAHLIMNSSLSALNSNSFPPLVFGAIPQYIRIYKSVGLNESWDFFSFSEKISILKRC